MSKNYLNENQSTGELVQTSDTYQTTHYGYRETEREERSEGRFMTKKAYRWWINAIGIVGGILTLCYIVALVIFSASNEPDVLEFIVFWLWTPTVALTLGSLFTLRWFGGKTSIKVRKVPVKGWLYADEETDILVSPLSVLIQTDPVTVGIWNNLISSTDTVTTKDIGDSRFIVKTLLFGDNTRLRFAIPEMNISPVDETISKRILGDEPGDWEIELPEQDHDGYILAYQDWLDLCTRVGYFLEVNGRK